MHCIAQRFGTWRLVLWCVALLPVLWTLLVLVLPSVWLKDELEARLSASLHAPAYVLGVRINPLTLQVNVTGVRIANPGGEGDLLVLDELTLRPALAWANGTAVIRLSLRVNNPVLDIAYLGRVGTSTWMCPCGGGLTRGTSAWGALAATWCVAC